jgi:hypothetical protein
LGNTRAAGITAPPFIEELDRTCALEFVAAHAIFESVIFHAAASVSIVSCQITRTCSTNALNSTLYPLRRETMPLCDMSFA